MSQTSPVSASAETCDSRYGLLPCPFCGSPARTDLLPHAQGPGWVQCSSCECGQHMSDTLEEAVVRWNTRTSVHAQTPRVTGASNIVEEAACLIWMELCPGLVMGDADLPHYEAAAKAVLALTRPNRQIGET